VSEHRTIWETQVRRDRIQSKDIPPEGRGKAPNKERWGDTDISWATGKRGQTLAPESLGIFLSRYPGEENKNPYVPTTIRRYERKTRGGLTVLGPNKEESN